VSLLAALLKAQPLLSLGNNFYNAGTRRSENGIVLLGITYVSERVLDSSACVQTVSGAHVASHSMDNGVKRPEGETDSSRQSNTTVRMRGGLHFLLHIHGDVFD
jgi:hypothetical protein